MVCPRSRNSAKINPSASQKTVPITFAADGTVFAFFLMESANGAIPYSAVSFQARKGETSFRHLSQYGAKNHRLRVDISAAVLR